MDKQSMQFAIRRVKDIYFYVNEDLYRGETTQGIKIELRQLFGTNEEDSSLKFTLVCNIHYDDVEESFAEIHVINVFDVPGLKGFIEDSFPTSLILSIVSLAVSHTRALLSRNLSGTVFDSLILPISDPVAIAKQLFPGIPIPSED